MLIQNISKRNFVLNIDGKIQTIVPNTLVEVSEELANDLINNYKNEWVEIKLPAKESSGQKAEKVIENKADNSKKKK